MGGGWKGQNLLLAGVVSGKYLSYYETATAKLIVKIKKLKIKRRWECSNLDDLLAPSSSLKIVEVVVFAV